MASAKKGNSFSVRPYVGDNKTLLAFNFANRADAQSLAGFTIECKPPGLASYYLLNELQFPDPSQHHQVSGQSASSSINAPFQKYRWIHVPGSSHQGLDPVTGPYVYTVTPRYFDASHCMQALDSSLSVSVTVPVGPFRKGSLSLGFTRGYMQSEAFVHHFGEHATLAPMDKPLLFDTKQRAATSPSGQSFTFADEYAWSGGTARARIFGLLNSVLQDRTLRLDVFAYDLDEPDIVRSLLTLAAAGRVRIILDNSEEHHATANHAAKTVHPEDQFEELFRRQAKPPADILRGCFARYAHDKIMIVSRGGTAIQVLTGSTNFSVNGLYVNANHVLVLDDRTVAAEYARVFEESWQILKQYPTKKSAGVFSATPLATKPFTFQGSSVPRMSINFSPHSESYAGKILTAVSGRIGAEKQAARGSVLFAVMQLAGSNTPVYETLNEIYDTGSLYSYGISDEPEHGTHLYAAGSKKGVLVTGKPGKTTLPAPFDQVPAPPGHEIHDKVVVCGLNGPDPVVYCGSSNLASGGEAANGDNLLEIHDADVATAFAIEVLLLVDHYNFLDRYAKPRTGTTAKPPAKSRAASRQKSGRKKITRKTEVRRKVARKAPRRRRTG
jgi:hypothetical protein